MEKKEILFLDTGSDSQLKLSFCLHMAGFRIIKFRTFDEAVNWGTTCSRPEDTLCVLINAQEARENIKKDLQLYRHHVPHLTVVWIDPEPPRGDPDLAKLENVIVCCADDASGTLKKLQENHPAAP